MPLVIISLPLDMVSLNVPAPRWAQMAALLIAVFCIPIFMLAGVRSSACDLAAAASAHAPAPAAATDAAPTMRGVGPEDRRAVNLLAPVMMLAHHPAFFTFVPHVQAHHAADPYVHDFIGMRTRRERYCNPVYMGQPIAHALRFHACARTAEDDRAAADYGVVDIRYGYPLVGEEYFEYIDALSAVEEFTTAAARGGRPFAVIEVGCGYCHWTATTLLAYFQRHGTDLGAGAIFRAIDGGEGMVAACKEHLEDNLLPMRANPSSYVGHFALVASASATPRANFSSAAEFSGSLNGLLVVPTTDLSRLIGDLKVVE